MQTSAATNGRTRCPRRRQAYAVPVGSSNAALNAVADASATPSLSSSLRGRGKARGTLSVACSYHRCTSRVVLADHKLTGANAAKRSKEGKGEPLLGARRGAGCALRPPAGPAPARLGRVCGSLTLLCLGRRGAAAFRSRCTATPWLRLLESAQCGRMQQHPIAGAVWEHRKSMRRSQTRRTRGELERARCSAWRRRRRRCRPVSAAVQRREQKVGSLAWRRRLKGLEQHADEATPNRCRQLYGVRFRRWGTSVFASSDSRSTSAPRPD